MSESNDLMTRRAALRRAAYVLGGALSAPTVAGVLSGCNTSPREAENGASTEPWAPQTLSTDQAEMVLAMGEDIIPETDTPGAQAARVDQFIDAMLTDYYAAERRQQFLAGLDRVDAYARNRFGARFLGASSQQQVALVEALNRAAFLQDAQHQNGGSSREQSAKGGEGRSRSTGSKPAMGDFGEKDRGRDAFFASLKELVVVGYYTSEAGATKELAPNPMGTWRADVPYAEVGQAWSY